MKIELTDEVRDVLARSTVADGVLKLPEQLERPKYVLVDKALKAMGGKWDRKAGGHVFPFDPAELLTGAVEDGEVVDRKKALQFFETPEALATRMVSLTGPYRRALEPSAGHGRIARVLIRPGTSVVAVEIDETNIRVLRENVPQLDAAIHANFLSWSERTDERFDAIVMNPPFTKFQDVAHIRAAHSLLVPGGRLVAICSESPFFRTDKVAVEFREWLDDLGATEERLDPSTFAQSGTNVNARLVVIAA